MSRPIFPGDGDPRHGTENGYGNCACRCEGCREAHRLYFRDRVRPRHPEYAQRTMERARRLRRQKAEAEGRTIRPPIDVVSVRQLAAGGLSVTDIAERIGRSASGVRKLVLQHDIPTVDGRLDPVRTSQLIECVDAGMSYVEAARHLGLHENTVRSSAWRRGLKLRDGRRKRVAS